MPAPSAAVPTPRAGGVSLQAPRPPAIAPAEANRHRALSVLLAVAWCAALAWLALATSNPVTLNRAQIRGAAVVATVRIEDRATGRCRLIRQWTGDPVPDEFVVSDLHQTAASGDRDWIVPLRKTSDGFEVQPSPLASQARLVYPATDEAVAQLREMVGRF